MMAFDLSTAKPERDSTGFDLSTAKAVSDGAPEPASGPSEEVQSALSVAANSGFNTLSEFAAAVNRGVVDLANLPLASVNAAMQLAGSESRIPTLKDIPGVSEATTGGFMEPGVARDIVRTGGEFAAPGIPVKALAGTSAGVEMADNLAKLGGGAPAPKQVSEIAQAAEEMTPAIRPAARVPGASSASEVVKVMTQGDEAAKQFAMNPQSPEFATKTLKGGKLVDDPFAKQAVTQGLDEGLVSMIKTSTPETKKRYAAMLNILKRGRENLRYANANRPWDIAGKSMADRVKYVQGVKKEAGKEVDEAAKALKGVQVDYDPAIGGFIDDLQNLGVTITRGQDGKIKPDFSQSVFKKVAKPKKIVSDIIEDLDTTDATDAWRTHIAKKRIDELVNWGQSASGSAGQVEGVAKRLRGNLNDAIGEVSPAYKQANTKYSESLKVLEDLRKSSGAKVDINDQGYASAVGTGLRRILGNTQSKEVLKKAANDIENVATKYGAEFGDDIRDQVSFANELDSIFGSAAKTSIGGEFDKSLDRVFEIASERGRTLPDMAVEGAQSAYKKMRGINEEGAIKALEQLIVE